MSTIAGHDFVETPDGRRCRNCQKPWVEVACVKRENIKQVGWAHTGELTEHEYNQIIAEVERLWEVGRGA